MDAKDVQAKYKSARDDSKEWRQEARDLYDLVAGHQWTDQEKAQMEDDSRLPIVMNRMAPFIDSIMGQQINNRKEVRYLPRQVDDSSIADMYTEAGRWADDLCDGEDEVSDSFYDLLVTGMGWTETRMDYSEDPQGLLKTAERIDPLEMYWDCNDASRNLSRSDWKIRAKKFPKEEAEARWPKIKDVSTDQWGDSDDNRQPHDATNAWKYENDQSPYNPQAREYLVLQCQYTKDEPVYRVADPDSGQIVTLPASRGEKMASMFDAMGVKYVKTTQKKYYQCFVCGETELEKAEGPSQKGFALQCMTGKRDRNHNSWYGPCRALKDPQKFSNKFFSDIMYILATNRKGGAFVETDALADPRKAEEQWADPRALIKLNPGALANGKVRERDAGVYPQGLDRLMQYAIDAVPATSGLNPEMIGMADRAQAGVLEAQRKQSALVILSPLFDALKRHQRNRGRVVLDFLHRFIADGRAIRITAPNGQKQSVPFMPAQDVDTYDIIVDEMPTTPNSKMETFSILSELAPVMANMGVMPPPEVLDYLPLPATLVEKWKAQGQQQSEQPDPEVQKMQMEQQAKQQEMAAKGQLEMLKMQQQEKMAAIQVQQEAQKAQIDQRKMELDAALKQMEAQVKAQELEIKRAELALKAKEMDSQRQEAQAQTDTISNGFGQVANQMMDALSKIGDAHNKSTENTTEAMRMMVEMMNAPREVVRDEKGRAVGTRVRVN